MPPSSHTDTLGAGNVGSAKDPTATMMKSGDACLSQKTVEPQMGQSEVHGVAAIRRAH